MQGFCNNCKRKPRFCLLDRAADAVFAPHDCAVGTRIAFVIKCFGKFSRKLRRELPDQEKKEILEIIKMLAAEKAEVS